MTVEQRTETRAEIDMMRATGHEKCPVPIARLEAALDRLDELDARRARAVDAAKQSRRRQR